MVSILFDLTLYLEILPYLLRMSNTTSTSFARSLTYTKRSFTQRNRHNWLPSILYPGYNHILNMTDRGSKYNTKRRLTEESLELILIFIDTPYYNCLISSAREPIPFITLNKYDQMTAKKAFLAFRLAISSNLACQWP